MAINPEELAMMQMQQAAPQPLTIDQVIQAYMQQALEIQGNAQLNLDVKAQTMLQMAQGLAALVPLATNDKEMELQLKAQEHQMDMEFKRAELQMKAEEHQMKLEQSSQSHTLKLRQNQENHFNAQQQKAEQSSSNEQK